MGFLTDPSTTQVDPTADVVKPLQGDISGFLQQMFQDPTGASPFGGVTSDLQRGATSTLLGGLGADPETAALEQLQPGLLDIFAGGSAEGVGQAALPIVQQELQRSLGSLGSSAPGRFGTAFASQGIDLASRAAQDFALIEAQARQQELQARLGAGGLLGTLAGQAGQGQFGRALGAAQIGGAQTQQQIDPILALLLGGLQFAQPQGKDTIVGSSPLDIIGQLGATAATAFGGGGG